jgi:hypothetical protein
MEEQVIEKAVESGIINMENGIRLFAAVGAATIGYYGYKSIKKALNKKKASGNVRKDDGKGEAIDVEAEVVDEDKQEKVA